MHSHGHYENEQTTIKNHSNYYTMYYTILYTIQYRGTYKIARTSYNYVSWKKFGFWISKKSSLLKVTRTIPDMNINDTYSIAVYHKVSKWLDKRKE